MGNFCFHLDSQAIAPSQHLTVLRLFPEGALKPHFIVVEVQTSYLPTLIFRINTVIVLMPVFFSTVKLVFFLANLT